VSGSNSYVRPLASLLELFDGYPFHAEISSIHIAADSLGEPAILVHLREMDPGILAAGLVEWARTLDETVIRGWRTPSGTETHISVTGYAPECGDVPIGVLTGPFPHSNRFDVRREPGQVKELDEDALSAWFVSETTNTWPFKRRELSKGATQ
jgi:hypothetical protein